MLGAVNAFITGGGGLCFENAPGGRRQGVGFYGPVCPVRKVRQEAAAFALCEKHAPFLKKLRQQMVGGKFLAIS